MNVRVILRYLILQMFTMMKPCLVLIMADSVKFASYFSTRSSSDHQTIMVMVHSLLQSVTNHIKVSYANAYVY